MHKFKNIYFDSDNKFKTFIRFNYKFIFKELFPVVCQSTNHIKCFKADCFFNDEMRDWTNEKRNDSFARGVVNLIKTAGEEFAVNEPENVILYINKIEYPVSIVGHEIIMHIISKLPISFSNSVMQWLLNDFESKVFVYTDSNNYLSEVKKILQKFSSNCDADIFQKAEAKICEWHNDTKCMCSVYQQRISTNKLHKYEPVYYSYWGHFQKELLPELDYRRLSKYGRELIEVLNRNEWIRIPHYNSGFHIDPVASVVSPIHYRTSNISDKSWLRIISTPTEKMLDLVCTQNNKPYHTIATHEFFAESLYKQAMLQPVRFAKLSFRFPSNCNSKYIAAVINSIIDYKGQNEITDVILMSAIIRNYSKRNERDILISIVRLIKKYAKLNWSEDILNIVTKLAIDHPEPANDEYPVSLYENPLHISPYSLLINSMNCVRGGALGAIASLLWEHPEWGNYFKETVYTAHYDKNPAIRFSVLACLLPYYNIDPIFSIKILKKLFDIDLRILAAPNCSDILLYDYQNDMDYYIKLVTHACKSDVEDLAEFSAGLLCIIAILFKDNNALNWLTSNTFTEKQQKEICFQAVSYFNQDEYHDFSQQILLNLIKCSNMELSELNNFFYKHYIKIRRDKAFLLLLMQYNHSERLIYRFLNYVNESNDDIYDYADIILTISKQLVHISNKWDNSAILNNLIQIVIRILNENKSNDQIKTLCLDIWDNIFKSNLSSIKPLSDMIDNIA